MHTRRVSCYQQMLHFPLRVRAWPWHGSEFALEDGRILNGPATEPQPCFAARERNGQIEVGGKPSA